MQEMSLTSFWIIAGSCVLVLGIMICSLHFSRKGAKNSLLFGCGCGNIFKRKKVFF